VRGVFGAGSGDLGEFTRVRAASFNDAATARQWFDAGKNATAQCAGKPTDLGQGTLETVQPASPGTINGATDASGISLTYTQDGQLQAYSATGIIAL
jgi:hypothetical protein